MSKLGDMLKVNVADTFAFYLKTHNFHWNVEGPDFYEYHKFFDTLYTEVWEAVYAVAEHLRTLDEYVPGSFSRFSELTDIKDETTIPSGMGMIKQLLADNEIVIKNLKETHAFAEKENEPAIVNFLEERIDVHSKHGWMLRASLKGR